MLQDTLADHEVARVRPARSRVWRPGLGWFNHLSLASQFLLVSFGVLAAGVLVVGAWVGQQIEAGVISRTGAITALYVESVLSDLLQPLASQPRLTPATSDALDRVLAGTPLGQRIQGFRVWSTDGEILYSSDRALVGRSFGASNRLARALAGEVVADLSSLDELENADLHGSAERLLEVYAPVQQGDGSRVLGVVEFYQRPDELENEMAAARARSWAVVGGTGLLAYLLVAGIVKRGSDTIARQQRALRQELAGQARLLAENRRVMEQNARLHARLQQAARQTTTLTERGLRRVSADLHAGPGQALALALLRLETVESQCSVRCPVRPDFAVVHGAVGEALEEVRAISAGLRLPELERLTVSQVAERVVRNHERRSGTTVTTDFAQAPEQAPLPIKMALYRALEEGLSNAARHGQAKDVRARIRVEEGQLCLTVGDSGPGFDTAQLTAGGRLGLAAVQERAALLGGHARVESAPGQGTTLRVWLALSARTT
jgi:signal transduction histidine kinase